MATYPKDIADELRRRETNMQGEFSLLGASPNQPTLPPDDFLNATLESVFFASLLDEEGDAKPIAVVLAPSGPDALERTNPPWTCFTWKSAALTPAQLRKLAMTSLPRKSYLIATLQADGPSISGVALPPPDRHMFSDDTFLRICATGPGALTVERGVFSLLRYAGGQILPSFTNPWTYNDLGDTVLAALDRALDGQGIEYLLGELIPAVVATGKGGMLAFATDPTDELAALVNSGRGLEPRIEIGRTFVDAMFDFQVESQLDGARVVTASPDGEMDPPSRELEEATWRSKQSTEKLERLVSQIGRLSAIDGAVLLDASLGVTAFGCKIPSGDSPPALRVRQWPDCIPYDASRHGTRHRAAVSFVAAHKGRLAICVSQDGPISAFFHIDGRLHCWPLSASAWH